MTLENIKDVLYPAESNIQPQFHSLCKNIHIYFTLYKYALSLIAAKLYV